MPNESEITGYSEILGVSEDASLEDLKKAYQKGVRIHHPDKGGDAEKFKELDEAYRALCELVPKKKGMGGSAKTQPFRSSYRGSSRTQQLRRGEDRDHPLEVSLEELYAGTNKELYLWREEICPTCKGNMKCAGCQGTGKVYRGYYYDLCDQCNGTRETCCPKCLGDKVVEKLKLLKVEVEKGMQNNQKIILRGQADETPDTVPGDLIVLIQQEEHPIFKRNGDDLSIEQSVSLADAERGFAHELFHLDGRGICFECYPGEVVKPNSSKVIDNEGMPLYQRPSMKGKLIIHFKVIDYMDIDKANAPEANSSPETSSAMELN